MDMKSWDTISSVSFSQINKHIKEAKSTPKIFEQIDTKNKKISGDWGDWTLTLDSNNQYIFLKCPIRSGNCLINGESFSLDNQWMTVRVRLDYYQESNMNITDSTATHKKGTQENLKIKTETDNPDIEPVVVVTDTSFKNLFEHHITNYVLCKSMFREYFKTELKDFGHIFAMVIINQQADDASFQWLKPTTIQYAVDVYKSKTPATEEEKFNKSVFSVMAMTEGRSAPDLIETSSSMLSNASGEGDAIFAISSKLIMKNWIFSGLMAIGIGKPDDYTLTDDGYSYTNNKEIIWDTFKDQDGKVTSATLGANKFSIGLNQKNGNIDLKLKDLTWSVSDGINISINYTQSFKVSPMDGNNTLEVKPLGKPEVGDPYISVSEERQKKELTIEIIEVVAGAILGAVLGFLGGKLLGYFAETYGETISAAIRTATRTGGARLPLGEALSDVDSRVTRGILESNDEEPLFDSKELGPRYELNEGESADLRNQLRGEHYEQLQQEMEMKPLRSDSNVTDSEVRGAFDQFRRSHPTTPIKSFISAKWKLAAGIIVGAAAGGTIGYTINSLTEFQKEQLKNKVSNHFTIKKFTDNWVQPIQWKKNNEFKIDSIHLRDGGLELIGKLVQTTS
ncbi:TPA: TULIP family P47-like protein [Bacillus toyonensis]|nr:TULIP family P47-like protein [Bacillus toyonensis]